MYPDLRSFPLCYPDTIQTIYKCCNFNYLSKQSQLESKKPDYDHLKVPPPFCVCDGLLWPTDWVFMIQCKFGELSRQASLLRHKGFWPVLSFLSQLFLSVFLVALVFCPSYLIISHISISLMGKQSQAVKVLPHLWWVCHGWWFSRVARNIGEKSQQTSNFRNTLPRARDFYQSFSFLSHLYLSASLVDLVIFCPS